MGQPRPERRSYRDRPGSGPLGGSCLGGRPALGWSDPWAIPLEREQLELAACQVTTPWPLRVRGRRPSRIALSNLWLPRANRPLGVGGAVAVEGRGLVWVVMRWW